MRLAILDLDGTVYRGSEVIPHAAASVQFLLDRGIVVRYLTNNSAAEPEAVAQKLNSMGVPCEPEWVYGTGPFAAQFVSGKVFVIGEPALHRQVELAGREIVEDEPADWVLTGICRSFCYRHIDLALQQLSRGANWAATNRDATYPREGGRFEPGAGAIVGAIAACTGQEPIVLGKPEPLIVNQILRDTGVGAAEAVMVGDRYETDILAGQRAGTKTWLVLTGVARSLPEGQPGSEDLRGLKDLALLAGP